VNFTLIRGEDHNSPRLPTHHSNVATICTSAFTFLFSPSSCLKPLPSMIGHCYTSIDPCQFMFSHIANAYMDC